MSKDKPITDEWSEQTGQLVSDIDTHIEMMGGIEGEYNRYAMRRMIFISLRQFFRDATPAQLLHLKQSA